jgi:hypothetical protein
LKIVAARRVGVDDALLFVADILAAAAAAAAGCD